MGSKWQEGGAEFYILDRVQLKCLSNCVYTETVAGVFYRCMFICLYRVFTDITAVTVCWLLGPRMWVTL